MLLWADSFDGYETGAGDLSRFYIVNTSVVAAGVGRRGTNGINCNGGSVERVIASPTPSLIVGASWKLSGFGTIMSLIEDTTSTVHCFLAFDVSGRLTITRGSVVVGTSEKSFTAGTELYVEWKFTIADSISANTCQVCVNGDPNPVLNIAAASDIKNGAVTANVGRVRFQGLSSSSIDDLYICDQSGPAPYNNFLGDCRADYLGVSGAGNYSQLTPSAGSNFQNVDEAVEDGDTTYNESSTDGHKDSYAMGNLPVLTSQTVYGVVTKAVVRKDDAGSINMKVGVRSGSTDSVGVSESLSTSYTGIFKVHESDPNTAAAWTESGVNNHESLIEVDVP